MSRRSMFLLFALGSLVFAAGLWRTHYAPSKTPTRIQAQAGTVFNDLGTFACGDSRYLLDITSMPSGSTTIKVVVDRGSSKQSVFVTGARRNEEWFVATDQYERMWIFVGVSSDDRGRQTPSVYMYGLAFDDDGRIGTMCSEVSRTGDWGGVPEEFLLRVRHATRQLIPKVPSVAPVLTSDRESRLIAELDKQQINR